MLDRLTEHKLARDATRQLFERFCCRFGGSLRARIFVRLFALIGVFCLAVVAQLQQNPLVQEIAEELNLLGRSVQLVELLYGNGYGDLSLKVG